MSKQHSKRTDIRPGVYVMQVASMLTGMHPQTLRKYERAGLLSPSRSKSLRMYSDEDIARLKMIKRLVDEVGLNLAGVGMALRLQARLLAMEDELFSESTVTLKAKLETIFSEVLDMVKTETERG